MTFTSDSASRLGRKGGKKGGRARLLSTTPEQRASIARKGGLARWALARSAASRENGKKGGRPKINEPRKIK